MPKIIPLCSSSKGNAAYIGDMQKGILIDVGCTFKMLNTGLGRYQLSMNNIQAICITHEHIDHVKGLLQVTKHCDIPIYGTKKTLDYLVNNNLVVATADLYDVSELQDARSNIGISAFRTPHDSVDSVGYMLELKNKYILGYCTDLGEITPEVRANMGRSDFVFLESNYDEGMLDANINYPYVTKERIKSSTGHLSNVDSSKYIVELIQQKATRFVLGHLSQNNNTERLAYNCTERALEAAGMECGSDYTLEIAHKSNGEQIII